MYKQFRMFAREQGTGSAPAGDSGNNFRAWERLEQRRLMSVALGSPTGSIPPVGFIGCPCGCGLLQSSTEQSITASPSAAAEPAASPFNAKVNFQPGGAASPAGFAADTGATLGTRGGGLTFGWHTLNSAHARDRDASNSPDQRYDTLTHMQNVPGGNTWEILVPNGQYNVKLVAGDPSYTDSAYKINVEGVLALSATPTNSTRWFENNVTVTVADGRLTLTNAPGAVNNKINYIEVAQVVIGAQTPFHGSPFQAPTTIQAEDFDNGGQGVAYNDVNAINRGNAYRSTGVDVKAGGTGHVVGWTSPGEWVEYTVNVPSAGNYLIEARVAAGADGGTFHVEFNGVNKTGAIKINHTGGWNNFQTVSRTVNLSAGQQVMRFAMDSGWTESAGNVDFFRLTKLVDTVQFNWQAKAAAPTPRFESYSVVVGSKLYMFGGYITLNPFNATQRVDVYDPATNTWSRKNDGPFPHTHAGAAYDPQRNAVYLVGGLYGNYPGQSTTDVWRYDVATDSWSKLPPLPQPLSAGPAAVVNGKLHYLGANRGQDRVTDYGDHYVLDLNGGTQWVQAAGLPNPRDHFSAVGLNGKLYAIAGEIGHDEFHLQQNSLHVYDPATNHWTQLANLPTRKSHNETSTFVRNGKIVVAGGQVDNFGSTDEIAQYDPVLNRWDVIGRLPQTLQGQVTLLVGDKLVTTTGWDPQGFVVDRTWVAVWT